MKIIGVKNNPCMSGRVRNLLSPNRAVASFRYAMPTVTFRDQSGLEVHYISAAKWMNRMQSEWNEPGGECGLNRGNCL